MMSMYYKAQDVQGTTAWWWAWQPLECGQWILFKLDLFQEPFLIHDCFISSMCFSLIQVSRFEDMLKAKVGILKYPWLRGKAWEICHKILRQKD